MICVQGKFAGEKVFEYFQDIDERKAEESFASGK